MMTFGSTESRKAASVDFDSIDVVGNRRVFASRKIDPTVVGCAVEFAHLPFACGHGLDQFAVRRIVIDMPPTRSVARPKERAVCEPFWKFAHFDPCFALFAQKFLNRAGLGIRKIQIEPSLHSILNFECDVPPVGSPSDTHDEKFTPRICREICESSF